MEVINNSMRYKTEKEKKQLLLKDNLYECFNDYFIAYKINNFDYPKFHYRYGYEKGKTYESYSSSVPIHPLPGLLVSHDVNSIPVRINYSDITAIIPKYNLIRCSKLIVL